MLGTLADGASEGTTHSTGTIGRRRGERREPWKSEKTRTFIRLHG